MAGDIRLSAFKAQLKDAARPNRFWITINPIGAAGADGVQSSANIPEWQEEPMSFLVKSAGLPAATIGEIELNWQGMKAKIAGDPTFEDFTVTFVNDYEFKAKNFIEKWMQVVAKTDDNQRSSHARYKTEILVEQLGRTGEVIRTYNVQGAYPKQMDQVELSMESTDAVQELSVTFGYDTWELGNTVS